MAALVMALPLVFVGESRIDAFAAPKELLLHLTVLIAAVALLRPDAIFLRKADLLLVAPFALGAVSCAAAQNRWLALRSLNLGTSATLLFFAARAEADAGRADELLESAVVGAALAAVVVLLEAHGLFPSLSIPGHAPGGTIGHRNHAAHLFALALPAAWFLASQRSGPGWPLAISALVAALVATRCRAAWVGALAGVVGAIVPTLRGGLQRRIFGLVHARLAAAALAGLVVGMLPAAALRWSSTTPVRDSVAHLFDAAHGSGRGRLIQYAATLELVALHPLLGVGPGNWSVGYPEVGHDDDGTYRARALEPVSRLPQSDWLGLASERGLPAVFCFIAFGVLLVAQALRGVAAGGDARAASSCALATVAAAVAVGAFDAVLLRPEPAAMAAVVLGACSASGVHKPPFFNASAFARRGASAFVFQSAAVAAAICAAMLMSAGRATERRLSSAWALHRGDAVFGATLVAAAVARGDCATAIIRARRLLSLYPHTEYAREVVQHCTHGARGPAPLLQIR